MSNEDRSDKTEKPTQKKLDDARKKGDVSKSRELTSTAGLALWLALGVALAGHAATRLSALFDAAFTTISTGWAQTGYGGAVHAVGSGAFETAVWLSALLLVPAVVIGVLVDFLQIGPVAAFVKVSPKLEHMSLGAGVKRMFSMDNFIEVVKALAKTILLVTIGWLIVRAELPGIVALARAPDTPGGAISGAISMLTVQLLGWTVAVFTLVSFLDAAYQRWSFTKKMRMSMNDLKDEVKETEGNPLIKGMRRQMQQEFAQGAATRAASEANVLVVNPTHLAIAINYDEASSPVPTIAWKGEGDDARAMREAAHEAGTPVVRNIPLARNLFTRGEVGEIVPSDLFDILAEVILWAREVREHVDNERARERNSLAGRALVDRRITAPGEDLTRYGDHDRSAVP